MRHLAALLAVSLAAPAFAQSPSPSASPSVDTSPGSTMALVLQLCQEDKEANFAVSRGVDPNAIDPGNNVSKLYVDALFGHLQNGSLGDTDTTIKEFMKKYGKLMDLPDGQDPLQGMKKWREWSQAEGKWISYCPTKDGLDYVSGMMTYVFRDNGQLCAILGRWKPIKGAIPAGLSKDAAIKAAQEEIKKDISFAEPNITGPVKIAECLVDEDDGHPIVKRLTTVTLDVDNPPTPKRVILYDGKAEWTEDGAYRGCTGKIFPHDPVTDGENLTKDDLPDISPAPHFWKSYVIDGKNVKVDSPGAPDRATAFFGNFSEEPFDPDPDPKFAEINAYYFITKALAKAQEAGLTDAELKPFLPLYFDHWRYEQCEHLAPQDEDTDPAVKAQKQKDYDACTAMQSGNAWFDPASHTLNFAADNSGFVRKMLGKTEIDKHPAYEGNVMAHEFGHWAHYIVNPHHNLGGTWAANLEAKSMAEGVADVFSGIVTGTSVIAPYFLDKGKRDMTKDVKYGDVIPIVVGQPAAGAKGKEFHDASLAWSSAYWHIKADMGEGPALKVLLAAMRVCHMPGKFQNMAEATLAMDQMLNRSPQGVAMAKRFNANDIVQHFLTLNR